MLGHKETALWCVCFFSYLATPFSPFLFRAFSPCWLMTGWIPHLLVRATAALTVVVFISTSLGWGVLSVNILLLTEARKWFLIQSLELLSLSHWPYFNSVTLTLPPRLDFLILPRKPMGSPRPKGHFQLRPFPPLLCLVHLYVCKVAKAGCDGWRSCTWGCFPPRAPLSKQLVHLSIAELVKAASGGWPPASPAWARWASNTPLWVLEGNFFFFFNLLTDLKQTVSGCQCVTPHSFSVLTLYPWKHPGSGFFALNNRCLRLAVGRTPSLWVHLGVLLFSPELDLVCGSFSWCPVCLSTHCLLSWSSFILCVFVCVMVTVIRWLMSEEVRHSYSF